MRTRALLAGLLLSSSAGWAVEPEVLREFSEVYDAVRSNYVDPVSDRDLVRYAIEGMLLRLDPGASLIDAEELRQNRAPFGGTGMELGMEDGFVKVITPIEGTPAQAAGIQPGDLLLAVDGQISRARRLTRPSSCCAVLPALRFA